MLCDPDLTGVLATERTPGWLNAVILKATVSRRSAVAGGAFRSKKDRGLFPVTV